MSLRSIKKPVSTFLMAVMIIGQIAFSFSYLLIPKQADAQFATASTTIMDWPRRIQLIVEGILMRVAQNYANKYLTRFVGQLQDKFKIRNFLFYDQYLTDYYLSNQILKHVSDPDLKEAMDLLYRAKVSGQTGGYTGEDPRAALIPRLKKAMADYYINHGGIDPNKIYNPAAGVTDKEYFATAQAYFSDPPSFTQQNIRAQFGEFQSAATTASQLEIMVGNALKAGRVIGGTCDMTDSTSDAIPKDPPACAAAGGTWKASLVDQARSFIENPTFQVSHYMENAINSIFSSNYDPNNIWTAIGSALGNYIFNQLNLDQSGGTFNDDGTFTNSTYQGGSGDIPLHEVDLDGDGFPDGQDNDAPPDGQLKSLVDVCYHGGVASVPPAGDPNASGCKKSSEVGGSPYFTSLCTSLDKAITELEKYIKFITTYEFEEIYSDTWTDRTMMIRQVVDDVNTALESYHNEKFDPAILATGAYLKFMEDRLESLTDDSFIDDEEVALMISNSVNILNFLKDFKIFLDKCDDPNFDAAGDVPAPDIGFPEGEGGGGGGGGGFITCDDPPNTISPDPMAVMQQVLADMPGVVLNGTDEQRDPFTREVAIRLNAIDPNWGRKNAGPGRPVSTDTLGYLRPDIGSGRFEAVDILVGGSGALQRGCIGVVGAEQEWVDPNSV